MQTFFTSSLRLVWNRLEVYFYRPANHMVVLFLVVVLFGLFLGSGRINPTLANTKNKKDNSDLHNNGLLTRLPISPSGSQSNGFSDHPALSADGHKIAFGSYASNLVPGDTNNQKDVFLYDMDNKIMRRVSISFSGEQANGGSTSPVLTKNGHIIIFQSDASNLVTDDSNGVTDIFLFDSDRNTIERVSLAAHHTQVIGISSEPAVSEDGRFIAFQSQADNLVAGDTNHAWDIFIVDRQSSTIQRASLSIDGDQANGASYHPAISGDGRFLAFQSEADNLVVGDTNQTSDIFIRDIQNRETYLVSKGMHGWSANGGSWQPSISSDGRFVAFSSYANNLVKGDTNDVMDVFVYDRSKNDIKRASLATEGTQGNLISGNPLLSADGRFITFESLATTLVEKDYNLSWDVYIHDCQTGSTDRITNSINDGKAGNDMSGSAVISADGTIVAFQSFANDLVDDDSNAIRDIFIFQRRQD
jgi:Tol biopolymer transport system component